MNDLSRSKPPFCQKVCIWPSELLIDAVFSANSPVGFPSESTTCTTELGTTKGSRSLYRVAGVVPAKYISDAVLLYNPPPSLISKVPEREMPLYERRLVTPPIQL